ncbi:diacylglycerol/lipid kinase family protein [Mycolicibacterium helvum]|uniref:Diacylglycerol kinase n=1 Tax=Mycolicibacterium helvum TaxID=1534349 RepID=A0A7I7T847_9MYCO|nr:diacylglycerol kinase family protein [Mycolicibacterium helvum]BBY65442.1 diacylglycerol kinase [Mycolicibacterium helvum]
MRAVLIVNPNATSTTPAGRDLLAHALESRVELTVVHTDHRGHAIEIAEAAKRDGTDVIIVHGGDGTVNEVVNGLMGRPGGQERSDPGNDTGGQERSDRPQPDTMPAVAVVPGGSANVFARALGISPDPTVATNQLVDLLSARRNGASWRRIGLMDCGERWAVFTAGMGVDGDVVAAVEAQRAKGRKVTAGRYIRVAVRQMLASARKDPLLTLELPGQPPITGVYFAFISNSSPWTYANTTPVWTNPDTTFGTGLGVFAVTSMNVWRNLMLVRRMVSQKHNIKAKHLIRDDDVAWVRIRSAEPVASQIDGDFLGLREEMSFRSVPEALSVVAPPVATPSDQRQ